MATKLMPHPRLYVTPSQLARLRQRPGLPALREAEREVARLAEEYTRGTSFEYPRTHHNAHLIRGRIAQKRIVTLLVRYFQCGHPRFRRAALAHVRAMGAWEYWSWITWRQKNPDPNAIFDLSYGENSATLAIAYDWLHAELSSDERAMFRAIALRRALRPFLLHTRPHKPLWWFKASESNWNSVCAGGAGMLAWAMHDELSEARDAAARAETSLAVFMETLQRTGGAWPEGLGYWNYGMRYAFMYLLSREHATGRVHPSLAQPATVATIRFPFDFCPNGVACSFGDVNHWRPLPFHYAAAERLGAKDVLATLDAHATWKARGEEHWPHAAELLLLHPRRQTSVRARKAGVVNVYRGQDWGVLADRMPGPRFYLAVRGGTTEVPHSHRDLLSFHAVVGDEALIPNLSVGEYLDTTFSPRRYELFETMPASKNTILINGVGITGNSRVPTKAVAVGPLRGIRMDATNAMGSMRDGPVAKFCGRLFLLLPGPAALLLDRCELPHTGRVESRFHTFARVETGPARVRLTGRRHSLTAAFASDVPAQLHRAVDAPTTPGPGATMIRWCTNTLHTTMTLATLLCPGRTSARVKVDTTGENIRLAIRVGNRSIRLAVTKRLRPIQPA